MEGSESIDITVFVVSKAHAILGICISYKIEKNNND